MPASVHVTVGLISAIFLVCGLGALLQSFGPSGIGVRLPFIMVPGGAAILMPGLFARFPPMAQTIFGNGPAMGTLSAVVFKVVCHHLGRQRSDDALPLTVEPEGARHAN